jgi:hypothetical protein
LPRRERDNEVAMSGGCEKSGARKLRGDLLEIDSHLPSTLGSYSITPVISPQL